MRAGLRSIVVVFALATPLLAVEPPRAAPSSPAQAAVAEGVALLGQNRVDEARERFQHALALDPRSADAHYMLGWVSEQTKDLDGAVRQYEAALAAAPRRADFQDRLGFVLGLQG